MINETILIIALPVILVFYTWYRISFWKKRIDIETREAENAVTQSFENIRKKIEKQVEMLDGNPELSPEEKEIRDKLNEALKDSEELIRKEIRDIKKEIG